MPRRGWRAVPGRCRVRRGSALGRNQSDCPAWRLPPWCGPGCGAVRRMRSSGDARIPGNAALGSATAWPPRSPLRRARTARTGSFASPRFLQGDAPGRTRQRRNLRRAPPACTGSARPQRPAPRGPEMVPCPAAFPHPAAFRRPGLPQAHVPTPRCTGCGWPRRCARYRRALAAGCSRAVECSWHLPLPW